MQPNGMDPSGSAIEYPTVIVDGQPYIVKFANESLAYRLSKSGLDLDRFQAKLKARQLDVATIYDALSAAIQVPPYMQSVFTGEFLSARVPFAEAARAVLEALGKVPPRSETVKLQEPAAKDPTQLQ